jgi:hypothetical protein
MENTTMTPETLAEKFHNLYEELAPSFGYETRKESAKPWADVPEKNKALMTEVCRHILASCNELGAEELTARFYQIKEQRDRFLAFCRVVCPEHPKGTALWDHEIDSTFVELMQRDRAKARDLLDEAASYGPVEVQDRIRMQIAAMTKPIGHPGRLIEALKAIADPEHCLTAHTLQGLRDIAKAAFDEIDPAFDYSSVTDPRCAFSDQGRSDGV